MLGETHHDTVASLNNLQALYYSRQRYPEAVALATRVLDIDRRNDGPDDPDVLRDLHNLATVHKAWNVTAAESLFLDAIAGRRRILGEAHASTARSRQLLAQLYGEQHRYAEAEPLALAAYDDGYVQTLGKNHKSTQTVMAELRRLYEAWGRPNKATEWRARLAEANR